MFSLSSWLIKLPDIGKGIFLASAIFNLETLLLKTSSLLRRLSLSTNKLHIFFFFARSHIQQPLLNILFMAILIVMQHIGSLIPINGIKMSLNKYLIVCGMQNINGIQKGLRNLPVNNCNTHCWQYVHVFRRILSSSYKLFSLFSFRLWAFRRAGSVGRNTHFLCHFFVFCFYLLVHTGFELRKGRKLNTSRQV